MSPSEVCETVNNSISRMGPYCRRGSLQGPEITKVFSQGRRHSTGQALTYRWAFTDTDACFSHIFSFLYPKPNNLNNKKKSLSHSWKINDWPCWDQAAVWRLEVSPCSDSEQIFASYSVINKGARTLAHTHTCMCRICRESTHPANTENHVRRSKACWPHLYLVSAEFPLFPFVVLWMKRLCRVMQF